LERRERAFSQVENLSAVLFENVGELGSSISGGETAQIMGAHFERHGWSHDNFRPIFAEGGAKGFMPFYNLSDCPLQRCNIEFTFKCDHIGSVVGGGSFWTHLRCNPHLPLQV